MTDEDLTERRRQLDAAKSPEEKAVIESIWKEHSLRCQAHTATRVKQLVATTATKGDITAVLDQINRLHSSPRWKEDKAGWIAKHWLEIVVFAYILKTLGIELGPLVKAAIGAFGG